jgi:hypothetical protein
LNPDILNTCKHRILKVYWFYDTDRQTRQNDPVGYRHREALYAAVIVGPEKDPGGISVWFRSG